MTEEEERIRQQEMDRYQWQLEKEQMNEEWQREEYFDPDTDMDEEYYIQREAQYYEWAKDREEREWYDKMVDLDSILDEDYDPNW